MQELRRVLAESYFTIIFLLATQLWTIAIAWRNRHKFPELRFFHFYPISAFLQSALSLSSIVFITHFERKIIHPSISTFLFLEFLLIYSVMFRIILMNRDRLLVRCLFVLYVIYCPVMWVFNDAFQKYYLVYIIQ